MSTKTVSRMLARKGDGLRRGPARTIVGATSPKETAVAAKPRSEPKNQDDPRGQFGPFLRDWIERNHGGDEKRLADTLEMGDRAIRKWMLGDSGPAFSDLQNVAEALGFADWADLARAVVKHAKKRQR